MTRCAGSIAPAAVLALSKSPTSELAAAALRAAERAQLQGGKAEYIVLAVPSGRAQAILWDMERAAERALSA